jgi:hypothetical protein
MALLRLCEVAYNCVWLPSISGDRGSTVFKALCYKSEGSLFRFQMVSLEFFVDIILPIALWPWGSTQSLTEMSTRSISWGKGGRSVRLTTLPPSCEVVTKSGNLNFLESPGPLQACNGTALPSRSIQTTYHVDIEYFVSLSLVCTVQFLVTK